MSQLPEGWARCTVGEIAADNPRSIAIGPFGSRLKSDLYSPSGIPVLRGQDITAGNELATSGLVYVPEDIAKGLSSCIVRQGDLVFPHRGAIGRVGIVGQQEFLMSSSMMKLSCNQGKVHANYLFYYFRGPGKDELLTRASTVGTPGIGQPLRSLRGISIDLPPLVEQYAIAEILGALDDKIAVDKSLADTSNALAAELLTDADIWVPISAVVGYKKLSEHPDAMGLEEVSHFSLPAFDEAQLPEITSPSSIKSAKFRIENPCVLISKLNPRFPRVWDLPELSEAPSYASTEFLVLESLYSSTSVLSAALRHPAVTAQLESKVAGTSGSHQRVKPADLLATEIPDPRELADGRVNAVTSLGRIVFDLRNEARTLASIRDTLLPQLMSGKLRVRDAEKQVEAVL